MSKAASIDLASSSAALPPEARPRSQWRSMAVGIVRRRMALAGLIIYGGVIFMAIFAGVIAPYNPNTINMGERLQGPSRAHWLGTDDLGRDVLTRTIYGSRVSIMVGTISIAIATLIGLPLGLISGYYGRWADSVISRVMDALLAFPSIILALAIMSVLGPNLQNAMIAIGIVFVPAFMRLTRAGVLSVKESEYVMAARVCGARDRAIMVRTILPNITSPLLVQLTLGFATAIIVEAALSFLGMGVQPPTPSWGAMLDTGRRFLNQTVWFSSSAGVAIFLTVLSLNLLGDGLRDVLDPRMNQS